MQVGVGQSEYRFSAMFPSSGNSTLEVLRRVFGDAGDVIEIGSGTGQHAVWFAAGLPHLVWRKAPA